jgi:hypothetical protein
MPCAITILMCILVLAVLVFSVNTYFDGSPPGHNFNITKTNSTPAWSSYIFQSRSFFLTSPAEIVYKRRRLGKWLHNQDG